MSELATMIVVVYGITTIHYVIDKEQYNNIYYAYLNLRKGP